MYLCMRAWIWMCTNMTITDEYTLSGCKWIGFVLHLHSCKQRHHTDGWKYRMCDWMQIFTYRFLISICSCLSGCADLSLSLCLTLWEQIPIFLTALGNTSNYFPKFEPLVDNTSWKDIEKEHYRFLSLSLKKDSFNGEMWGKKMKHCALMTCEGFCCNH